MGMLFARTLDPRPGTIASRWNEARQLAGRGWHHRTWLGHAAGGHPFSLLRWFAGVGLICIVTMALGTGFFLSRFLTDYTLRRDAEVSAEFIDGIVRAERTWSYFADPDLAAAKLPLESFFNHVAQMADVARANVYSADGVVLWSSTPALIGLRFAANDELEQAFTGAIVTKAGNLVDDTKPEHVGLDSSLRRRRFLEAYLPIHDAERRSVIGVVEIYRTPDALFQAVDRGVLCIWLLAAGKAILLYGSLLWIAARASRVMHRQQAMLVEAETLAAIGAVATAVAHGVRNPLASIRTSAELAGMLPEGPARSECLGAIQRETDRVEGWVRDLLLHARGDRLASEAVEVHALLRESLRSFAPTAKAQGVCLDFRPGTEALLARATSGLLTQALENLIANAIEAMPGGGELRIDTAPVDPEALVEIRVADEGVGLPTQLNRETGGPLASTKPQGTGFGLLLARRIIAGSGGTLRLERRRGGGTTAIVRLPAAEA